MKRIISLTRGERCYIIGGVRYIVSSGFTHGSPKTHKPDNLTQKLQHYLGGDFADLTKPPNADNLSPEYACSAAGEEEL